MNFLTLPSSHALISCISVGLTSLCFEHPNGIDITITDVATRMGCTDLSVFANLPAFGAVYQDMITLGYAWDVAHKRAGQEIGRALRYVLDQQFVYTKLPNRGFKSQYRLSGVK